MSRTITTLTRVLAGTAIALTGVAATSVAASAAPVSPAPQSAQDALEPQGVGGGLRGGYVYWDWYSFATGCISAGERGQDRGAWSDYQCRPTGSPGMPWTVYRLYVKY